MLNRNEVNKTSSQKHFGITLDELILFQEALKQFRLKLAKHIFYGNSKIFFQGLF